MEPITDAAVEAYLHATFAASNPILQEMEREASKRDFPIIGPLVGRFCQQQAQAIGARRVFEMGSGFGYSTLWFAQAVGPQGTVVHTEASAQLSTQAQQWLTRAKLADRVQFRLGDARQLLDDEIWDIIFIDIDKHQYPDAWQRAAGRVRPGGLIITDNALWSGRVADPAADDANTRGVREYTRLALADSRFLTTIVPLRDGVAVSLRLAH